MHSEDHFISLPSHKNHSQSKTLSQIAMVRHQECIKGIKKNEKPTSHWYSYHDAKRNAEKTDPKYLAQTEEQEEEDGKVKKRAPLKLKIRVGNNSLILTTITRNFLCQVPLGDRHPVRHPMSESKDDLKIQSDLIFLFLQRRSPEEFKESV